MAVSSEGGVSEAEERRESAGEAEAEQKEAELVDEGVKNCSSDSGEALIGSDRESTTATPSSSRSPSVAASTTTISSSDNAS